MPAYDILQIQRPTLSRSDEMRQTTNMNSYQTQYQPIQWSNTPFIPYYPVLGQRQNSSKCLKLDIPGAFLSDFSAILAKHCFISGFLGNSYFGPF